VVVAVVVVAVVADVSVDIVTDVSVDVVMVVSVVDSVPVVIDVSVMEVSVAPVVIEVSVAAVSVAASSFLQETTNSESASSATRVITRDFFICEFLLHVFQASRPDFLGFLDGADF
jgi:hypothetical protein